MTSRKQAGSSHASLETAFFRRDRTTFAGYAVDLKDLSRNFTVDVLIDGHVGKSLFANQYVRELAERGIGSGCYGFTVNLAGSAIDEARFVEARVSNLPITLGPAISLEAVVDESPPIGRPAQLRWLGGLRFTGWIDGAHGNAPRVEVSVDGEPVARTRASGWAHIESSGERASAVRAFDFHVPERFADGRVHYVGIADEGGRSLVPAPIPFVAFADGLARSIEDLGDIDAERLRGELFDRLLPMSVPLANYAQWRSRFPLPPVSAQRAGIAVIIVGADDVAKTLASLDRQACNDWVAASLSLEGRQSEFEASQACEFLQSDASDCELVVFAMSGAVLEADALARISDAFGQFEQAELVYCDVDIEGRDGARWPLALSAFDYERLLEQGYCAHFFAMRRGAALRALAGGASSLYRLANSVLDDGAQESKVVHIPGGLAVIPAIDTRSAGSVLARAVADHLEARGVAARIAPARASLLPAVRVSRSPGTGRTTVVIPARNGAASLRRCLDTIGPAVEQAGADVLIIDNGSTEPEMLDLLGRASGAGIGTLKVGGPFNLSRLINSAVSQVDSEYICLLDNRVEALDDQWLVEMLGRLAAPEVGAVGAMLVSPSGVIRHGGVVLGPGFAAQHAFTDRMDGDSGFGDLLCVAHECSAVTAACMLTRRSDWMALGGMDEVAFPVALGDVDYCLKLRASGRRIVMTPHAKLLYRESRGRGSGNLPHGKAPSERELQWLRARWSDALADDPYYSPVLSLDPVPYSALAWPPRSCAPRTDRRPTGRDVPPGF